MLVAADGTAVGPSCPTGPHRLPTVRRRAWHSAAARPSKPIAQAGASAFWHQPSQGWPCWRAAARTSCRATPRTPTDTASVDSPTGQLASLRQLSDAELLRFERDGHLSTPGLLPTSDVAALRDHLAPVTERQRLSALRHRVRVLCPGVQAAPPATEQQALRLLRQHGVDELGFIQVFHTWRELEPVYSLVLRLAGLAAALLDVPRVRLYQVRPCAQTRNQGVRTEAPGRREGAQGELGPRFVLGGCATRRTASSSSSRASA